jgi:transcriptional regulator
MVKRRRYVNAFEQVTDASDIKHAGASAGNHISTASATPLPAKHTGTLGTGQIGTLDIGGTWIRSAVMTLDGAILSRSRRPMPQKEESHAVVDTCLDALGEARMQADCHALERIGVSVTGPVDPRTGKLFTPPNTGTILAGLELGEALSRAACLEVRVDRDTNAAALGEHRCGSARGMANFVFITVSTGVGGAVMLDGRLIRGADGVAGEIGHICVERGGPQCGCGRRGCVEAIASGPSIARRAEAELRAAEGAEFRAVEGAEFRAAEGFVQTRTATKSDEGSATANLAAQAGEVTATPISSQASSFSSQTSSICSQASSFSSQTSSPLAERLRSGRPLTGKDVDECAAAGDPHAIRALDAAAAAVASMCVDMANVFNPERIVVGGSVAITHPDWIARASELVAREALAPANREGIVVPAELGDDVSLVGAAFL